MWSSSPGSDGPTSELYRLMPPPRPGDDDPVVDLTLPHQGWWRELTARARPASRRAAGWALGLFTAAAAVVIGSLAYAWLTGH